MKQETKNTLIAVLIFILILGSDIITKALVEKYISMYERVNVLGSFVQLTLIYNQGGIFGILQGYQQFFLIISIIVFLLLVAYFILEKNKTLIFTVSMGLICAGAIGNILDRITGKPGVVDFIYIGSDDVFRWPAFNIADSSIVVGATLLVIHQLIEEKKRKAQNKYN
ncbi:MAG TPA: signal peptidase II [Spirochaetota bacterium]|nr:signal peptidase II [Spirochaetota bacterium]HOJ27976.1 signal peptidase II [Spirochaetota bacterium]HOM09024.1 signal peptidase II [Spirochaetota bacterium]HPP48846.1 signal peptidase II [Spirochaetota bacterium]HXK65582.1 signal peptidase II [Spirochaetota bacterium]